MLFYFFPFIFVSPWWICVTLCECLRWLRWCYSVTSFKFLSSAFPFIIFQRKIYSKKRVNCNLLLFIFIPLWLDLVVFFSYSELSLVGQICVPFVSNIRFFFFFIFPRVRFFLVERRVGNGFWTKSQKRNHWHHHKHRGKPRNLPGLSFLIKCRRFSSLVLCFQYSLSSA